MTSQFRKTRSSRRSRSQQLFRTGLLAFFTLVLAGLIIAGPKLFAQAAAPTPAPTAAPAPAPAGAPTAAPAPAHPGAPAQATAAAPAPAQAPPTSIVPATPPAPKVAASGESVALPWGNQAWPALIIVLVAAFVALAFGVYWWRKTVAQDPGSERMQGVAAAVQEGAMAYLSRQVKTMIPLVIIIGIGLFFLYKSTYTYMGEHESLILGLGVAVAFILGVTASYLAGYVGMGVAVRGNVRVANAALSSFKRALETAFQAGAVSGMFTVGLGLLGATITFMLFKQNAMFVLVGFGFGGSLAALFMRVGGGIFTKAADVGADLVGKVEAGIPEDDPRNAATIADNVGDNVGDCAGMAADVFESYEVTLVASIILAAAVGRVLQTAGFGLVTDAASFTFHFTLDLVIYALLVRAVGVVASIVGVLAVKGKDDAKLNPMEPINVGFMTSAIIASLGFLVVSWLVFGPGLSLDMSKAHANFSSPTSAYTMPEAVTTSQAQIDMRWDTMRPSVQKQIDAFPIPLSSDQQTAILNSFQPTDIVASTVSALDKLKALHPDMEMTKAGIEDLRESSMKTLQPAMQQAQYASIIHKTPQKMVVSTPDERTAIDTFVGVMSIPQAVMSYTMQPGSDTKEVNAFLSGLITHETLAKQLGDHFWFLAFLATFIGIVLTQVIGKLTEYFTAEDKRPVTEIASAAKTGAATLILSGLSEGMESAVWGIVAIAVTIYGAYRLFPEPAMAAYAIALTGLGLLATTGYVLAMDTYGPISDNANGIFEMSGALKNADGSLNTAAHNIVARLDMVGNTTKALTKGFAIATAVIAAVALYRSFLDTVATKDPTILVKNIQVNLPDVFVGLLIGGAIPFLFSSFAIRAVSRAAVQLVEEVRRQFRTIPGIWEYTGVGEVGKPDYARCVAISTAAAQKELLGPGLLAVFAPIFVGFSLGAYALGGFLAGAILVGQLMAVFMSNTGGAWDNAKKKIEDGFLGGKGSEAHKAGVIGDTVGDPLKDTAGPALNPMIKVMNLVAILVAPMTVVLHDKVWGWVVAIVALIILIIAVMFSKRGGVENDNAAGEVAIEAPRGK